MPDSTPGPHTVLPALGKAGIRIDWFADGKLAAGGNLPDAGKSMADAKALLGGLEPVGLKDDWPDWWDQIAAATGILILDAHGDTSGRIHGVNLSDVAAQPAANPVNASLILLGACWAGAAVDGWPKLVARPTCLIATSEVAHFRLGPQVLAAALDAVATGIGIGIGTDRTIQVDAAVEAFNASARPDSFRAHRINPAGGASTPGRLRQRVEY